MRLQVKGKNVEVTPSIRAYAERKLGKLEKQLAEQTQVEVELSEQRNPSIAESHVAEGTIFTKGPTLRAREASPDMKVSIDQLVEKLERQVKKYRERRTRRASAAHRAQRRHPRLLTRRRCGSSDGSSRCIGHSPRPAGLSLGDGSAPPPGPAAAPPGWDGEQRGEPGIHGVPRARRWDAVVAAHAPELHGDTVHFVALGDGSLVVDEDQPDDALTPLADALETRLAPPYRAEAVRRDGSLWGVAGRRIALVREPGARRGGGGARRHCSGPHVDGRRAAASRATRLRSSLPEPPRRASSSCARRARRGALGGGGDAALKEGRVSGT